MARTNSAAAPGAAQSRQSSERGFRPINQRPNRQMRGPVRTPAGTTAIWERGIIGRWRLGCAPLIEDHREKVHGTLAGQSSQHPVQPLPVPGPRRPGVLVGDDQDSHADRPPPPEQRGGGGGAE